MAKILAVDDLEMNRYLLNALLSGHGHAVLLAENGEEALRVARSEPVDLIITDILMPVMDGYTLCRTLKADETLSGIPFIFYTATYTDPKDIDFGLSLGADLFLIKPSEPADLMEAINRVLWKKATEKRASKAPPEESVYLRHYNEALIRKLEDKMVQLEAEVVTRRRTEERLLRFKTAIDNADEAIMLTDHDGVVDYVNPAFERTTGYSKEDALGHPPEHLEDSKESIRFFGQVWETIRKGKVWRGHLAAKTKAGKTMELEATVSPISGESGRSEGYVSVIRDVTQQMALERQLAQSQKMDAIGALAGGIAHDFNNILSVILGYTQLVLLQDQLESEAAENLGLVLDACARARLLVDQILTFSRKTERRRVQVDLTQLINEIHKFLRASIPATIDIRIEQEAKNKFIKADPTQVQQVILNLCTNAVHAMRDTGGVLCIRLRNIELDEMTAHLKPDLAPGRYLLLSVADNGCGMTPDIISKIFEPFFTTKPPGEGTGLGLSVAYGIVRDLRGAISVYSDPGQGATFNVYFPVAEGLPEPAENRGLAQLPTGKERILFVDDEPELVKISKRMLERLGYQVVTAMTGMQALQMFAQSPGDFDLVMTDQTMRGMTGTELAGEILKLRRDIPVILCSGFSAIDTEQKALEIGVAERMAKPFNLKDLAVTVRKVLDGR